MAFHDWNHDGEKDWKDNAIEYQLLKNMNIEFEKAFEKAVSSADEFAYPQYKPRCVENMYEYIGI